MTIHGLRRRAACSRVDGRAKVTGAARTRPSIDAAGPRLWLSSCRARSRKGRIARIDTAAALAVPGVLAGLHAREPAARRLARPQLPRRGGAARLAVPAALRRPRSASAGSRSRWWSPRRSSPRAMRRRWCGSSTSREPHAPICKRSAAAAYAPKRSAPASTRRRARAATPTARWAGAPMQVEHEYQLPVEHHNPMELHATTAVWEGDGKLTVYDKTQGVAERAALSRQRVRASRKDDVRVVSPFVGGAFGSGLRPQYQVSLAVLAARELERLGAGRADPPADVHLRPPPATRIQTLSLAAGAGRHAAGDHVTRPSRRPRASRTTRRSS